MGERQNFGKKVRMEFMKEDHGRGRSMGRLTDGGGEGGVGVGRQGEVSVRNPQVCSRGLAERNDRAFPDTACHDAPARCAASPGAGRQAHTGDVSVVGFQKSADADVYPGVILWIRIRIRVSTKMQMRISYGILADADVYVGVILRIRMQISISTKMRMRISYGILADADVLFYIKGR